MSFFKGSSYSMLSFFAPTTRKMCAVVIGVSDLTLCSASLSPSQASPDVTTSNSPPEKGSSKHRKKAKLPAKMTELQASSPNTQMTEIVSDSLSHKPVGKNSATSDAGTSGHSGLSYSTHTPDVKCIPPPFELLNR
jgi:hypothetical protein